jgi:NAD(P)-dependent dehydrogenase (short-subunit alcohol dehydrogenase family)
MGRLDGLVALVTGAAHGMGAAYARGFAREGAVVVLADVDLAAAKRIAAELAASGAKATAVAVDMGEVVSVRTMVDQAVAFGGTLDVLVNNAGIGIAKPLLDYTEADWDRQLAVNAKGSFFALQAAARVMIPNRRGKIVNVASTAAFVSSSTPEAVYDVSKAAVRQLTVSAGAELAAHGINVNGIAPGTVATELTRQVLDTPDKLARAAAKIPLGRLATPEDLVGTAVFLASADADYLCGHVVVVDGGWLLY